MSDALEKIIKKDSTTWTPVETLIWLAHMNKSPYAESAAAENAAKDEALSATIVYMKLKMKEPYTQVEIDTLQAAIDAHDALATPAKPSGAGATPMTSPTKEGA